MLTIRVFEHQTIHAGELLIFYRAGRGEKMPLHEKYIQALWKMYDEKKRPFFSPTRKGIKLRSWVGVIKVLDLIVEILPKADKFEDDNDTKQQNKWHRILIEMLSVCRSLDTPSLSDASLKLKSNSILDLYIARYIKEVDYLLHIGLIKRYRKEDINHTALKGRLVFQEHVTRNVVHKELFYITKASYDRNHLLHQILAKAIKVIPHLSSNQDLISRSYQLQLNFPEMKEIKVDASTFAKLHFDRKSDGYKTAIQIAKLLLLNYRPNVSSGSSHSIAILFDMNKLWEEYIYRMLQKANDGTLVIHNQRSTKFWSHSSINRFLKPDIIIEKAQGTGTQYVVIDTKWKNIFGSVKNISMDDLRQMFAYHHYFDAARCYLLFPGRAAIEEGSFVDESYFIKDNLGSKACGVIVTQAWVDGEDSGFLDRNIGKAILTSLKLV